MLTGWMDLSLGSPRGKLQHAFRKTLVMVRIPWEWKTLLVRE